MAKRFIDTSLFKDSWFSNLSKDGKIAFVWLITNCDHAGIIDFNEKLFCFETGIKSWLTVSKELANCYIAVRDNYLFLGGFVKYQYQNLSMEVKAQASVIKRLKSFNLMDSNNCIITVNKQLDNSLLTVQDKDMDMDKDKVQDMDKDKKDIILKNNKKQDIKVFINDLPNDWKELVLLWINYKNARKENYKNSDSIKAVCKKLIRLSNNDVRIARLIIEEAMASNYSGFFSLKEKVKFTDDYVSCKVLTDFLNYDAGGSKYQVNMILLTSDQFNELKNNAYFGEIKKLKKIMFEMNNYLNKFPAKANVWNSHFHALLSWDTEDERRENNAIR